jgi:hypothetical protein
MKLKNRYVQLRAISLIIALLLLMPHGGIAEAATCSGSLCNGLNPNTTGCDVSASTIATEYPASSRIELRQGTCSTQWAKTTNTDSQGRLFFLNATLQNRYYTASSYSLPVNSYVYSAQHYSTGNHACGYASFSYIGGLVSSPCTP